MTHVQSAVRRFRKAPFVRGVATKQLYVTIASASASHIAAGIRALAKALKDESYVAYVALEKPQACQCVSYGPVRRVSMWSQVPGDGGEPRFIHRLDVGVIA